MKICEVIKGLFSQSPPHVVFCVSAHEYSKHCANDAFCDQWLLWCGLLPSWASDLFWRTVDDFDGEIEVDAVERLLRRDKPGPRVFHLQANLEPWHAGTLGEPAFFSPARAAFPWLPEASESSCIVRIEPSHIVFCVNIRITEGRRMDDALRPPRDFCSMAVFHQAPMSYLDSICGAQNVIPLQWACGFDDGFWSPESIASNYWGTVDSLVHQGVIVSATTPVGESREGDESKWPAI